MDWFPLFNSVRIAAISTVIVFFAGVISAYYIAKTPKLLKGVLDVILTLPLGAAADGRGVSALAFFWGQSV
jgi:molybdate transport system permease protein